jgi:hypothetical protein
MPPLLLLSKTVHELLLLLEVIDALFEYLHDRVHLFGHLYDVIVEGIVVHVDVMSVFKEHLCEVAEGTVQIVSHELFEMLRTSLSCRVVKVVDGGVEAKVEDAL